MQNRRYGQQIVYFGLLWVIVNLSLHIPFLKTSLELDFLSLHSEPLFDVLLSFFVNGVYYTFLYLVTYLICAGVIALFPITLNRLHGSHWLSSGVCIILFSVTTIFFLMDAYVFENYGFHINLQLLDMFSHIHTKNLLIAEIKNHLSISNRELLVFSIVCGSIFLMNGFLFVCAQKIQTRKPLKYHLYEMYIVLMILSFCLTIHIKENVRYKDPILIHAMNQHVILQSGYRILRQLHILPDYGHMLPCETIHTSQKMYFPPIKKYPALQTPNILWIVIDTLRYDAITPELTPTIYQFAQDNIQFLNHQSSGNSTLPGVFGMLYGLPSNYFSSTLSYHSEPLLFQMLKNADYDNHVFFSGTLQNPPFIQNAFYHFPKQNIHLNPFQKDGNEDEKTVEQLQNFLNMNHDKPFFSFAMLNSVHNYCLDQNYKLINQKISDCDRFRSSSPVLKSILTHRYDNAVHHIDELLAHIFKTLQQNHLNDNTIVIFTSDHGENFNDYNNNLWGHSNSYTPTLIHVPLFIHLPHHSKQQIHYQTTHYDIPTTLLNLIFGFQQQLQEFMIGNNLFSKNVLPFFLAGSYVTMAIVTPDEYYIFDSDGDLKTFNQKADALPQKQINREYFYKALHLMSKFYAHEI